MLRLFTLLLLVGAVAANVLLADHCNPSQSSFKTNNRAQMDGVCAHPLTDLWYQNITVMGVHLETGEMITLLNYGYWASRIYSPSDCAFIEVQAYYRSANQLGFQQINSIVDPPSVCRDGVNQTYTIDWKTGKVADSILIENMNVKSDTTGPNVVRFAYSLPKSKRVMVTEEIRIIDRGQRRFFSQVLTFDPSDHHLPLLFWTNSYVVGHLDQPVFVSSAFASFAKGDVPQADDPLQPGRIVYLYTDNLPHTTLEGEQADHFLPRSDLSIAEFLGHVDWRK